MKAILLFLLISVGLQAQTTKCNPFAAQVEWRYKVQFKCTLRESSVEIFIDDINDKTTLVLTQMGTNHYSYPSSLYEAWVYQDKNAQVRLVLIRTNKSFTLYNVNDEMDNDEAIGWAKEVTRRNRTNWN